VIAAPQSSSFARGIFATVKSMVPENGQQNDDGQGNAQQPKQQSAAESHDRPLCFLSCVFNAACAYEYRFGAGSRQSKMGRKG